MIGWIPFFFATSGPTKRRKHYVCLLFFQYCVCYFLNISRNPNLRTSPKNQFRDYHAWNRIKKLMPQHWKQNPHTFKTLRKTANLFSNLDFLQKSRFPKTLDLSMDFPWISHPPHEFSGRPQERPTKTKCFSENHNVPWGPMGSPWLPWKIQECRKS